MEKWYEKVRRYGQVNLTEVDPEVCDIGFWREFWEKTHTQAVIINAGGIVAYYPSKFSMHYRAAKLGDRDFFGDFVAEGRKAGLVVLARMDINRAIEDFYKTRPDWFARHRDGSPFTTQRRYQSCVNSGYYKEFIPDVLKEIIERYHPDGFTDNSWTGIRRQSICYCDNCKHGFHEYSGEPLPEEIDYQNPVFRKWIEWSYKCRMDNWHLYNKVAVEYGGPDCLWLGMVGGANYLGGRMGFSDIREVARKSKVIMVDHQGRDGNGFEQNSFTGLFLHQMAGWDKIIPESMSSYVRGIQSYRRSASPPLEMHLWMLEGISGGITPWWHIVGGAQEDKRIYGLCLPIMEWHKKHEKYLYNRTPIANVGILWSQVNTDFYGAAEAKERVELAYRGIIMALTRTGIPYLPIHIEDMEEQIRDMDLLILPEMAVISDRQAETLEKFVDGGGSILAIGDAGIMDIDGSLRKSSALEKLLGIRFLSVEVRERSADASLESSNLHNYLRIEQKQHPLFAGYGNTDILPMGGLRRNIAVESATSVLATLIPSFPIYPPEFSWAEVTRTDKPVITEHSLASGGKAIYVAWELDAVYGRCALPDQGNLIGNMVKYMLGEKYVVKVECNAYVDFKFYRQGGRLIVHLINTNHTGFDHGYAENNLPVGPVRISIRLKNFSPSRITATEDGRDVKMKSSGDGISIELDRLYVHQLLILE
jgi:hypothetical protein